jgi:hypothetical protein
MEYESIKVDQLNEFDFVYVMDLDENWNKVVVDCGWYLDYGFDFIRIFSKTYGVPMIERPKKIFKKIF